MLHENDSTIQPQENKGTNSVSIIPWLLEAIFEALTMIILAILTLASHLYLDYNSGSV